MRIKFLSLFSRGGSVGDHQRLILSHTAGRDRRIGGEQPGQHGDLGHFQQRYVKRHEI
jgi:hypothetical protein